MSTITDPLEASDLLKSATIYRNSEFSYIYVCYHCAFSFTNIEDTLNHVESHFDQKMDFVHQQCSLSSSEIGGAPQSVEANTKIESNLLETMMGDECVPVHIKVEYETAERENYQDTKDEFISTFTNEYRSYTDDTTYRIIPYCEVPAKIENRVHRWSRYIKKPLKICAVCSATFSTKKKILSHLKREHFNRQPEVKKIFYDCEKCNRNIEGRFEFFAHQYGHNTNDDDMDDDEVLLKNLRKFLDENTICDVSTPVRTFGCKICDDGNLRLKKRYYAARHILQKHVYPMKWKLPNTNLTVDKQHVCEFCGKKFSLAIYLVKHRRIHTLEKPFTCKICNKSFSQSSYVKYHEQIHTELYPHQCSICGRSFKTVLLLKSHNRVHASGVTKCPICNKEQKSYRLRIHIRDVHESDHRPYKCPVCSEAFKTQKTLKIHSLRHTDEKNYKCRFKCKQTFISAAGRRAHERTKHKNDKL